MRPLRYSPLVALAAACFAPAAWAVETTPAPPPPVSAPSADSLIFSANGSTLTDASGGGGGSIGWLHDFSAGVLGLAGEYQTLADAHWEFGSLTGAVSTGSASAKWTFSADAHLGSGDIGVYQGLRRFNYDVEGADVAGTFGGKLTLQLDAQQYDIDTTHGALPKVGAGVSLDPALADDGIVFAVGHRKSRDRARDGAPRPLRADPELAAGRRDGTRGTGRGQPIHGNQRAGPAAA